MTLSLFDTQLLEKVLIEKFPEKQEFSRTEIIVILNEMTKAEKYYPRGKITKGQKYKIFKYFVRYCLYRNLANFDTMLLLTGDKGCISGDTKIQVPEGEIEINKISKRVLPVKCYDAKHNKMTTSMAEVFPTGEKPVYEVEFEDGSKIKCTKDHKFLINGKYKKLRDLKDSDGVSIYD